MAQIFREVASEVVEIEAENGTLAIARWEAMVRQIHTMALNKDASAARLIHQLRKQFRLKLRTKDSMKCALRCPPI